MQLNGSNNASSPRFSPTPPYFDHLKAIAHGKGGVETVKAALDAGAPIDVLRDVVARRLELVTDPTLVQVRTDLIRGLPVVLTDIHQASVHIPA